MGKKDVRLNRLVEILRMQNGGTTIRELASMLDVSEMTIRRDLEVLKAQNIVLDIPGAGVLNSKYIVNQNEEDGYQLSVASKSHRTEKSRLGKFAASLIKQDDCVIIDNGSTMECLAENLDCNTRMTILTCNLNILNKICNNPNFSIIFGGGYYHPDTTLFESAENIELIKNTRATKVFASAAGVHSTMGITCAYSYELETKQALLESGAEKILLVDSSKFDIIKPCFWTDIDAFDHVITDKNISEEWIDLLKEKGIRLDIV